MGKNKKYIKEWIKVINENKGFTIMELMVVIAITSIILLAIGKYMESVSGSQTLQRVTADTNNDCRQAVEYMSREIRMAGLNPWRLDDGTIGIITATPANLIFTSDFNSTGDIQNNESFNFLYTPGNGTIQVTDGGAVTNLLLDNVTNFTITYFDENGVQLVGAFDVALVRTIGLDVTVTRRYGRETATRRLQTVITCRNLST